MVQKKPRKPAQQPELPDLSWIQPLSVPVVLPPSRAVHTPIQSEVPGPIPKRKKAPKRKR